MTAFLVGELQSAPTYDRRVGQYRGDGGKFVPRAQILKLVDEESARLETRLKAHARLLTQNKIDLPVFQQRMAEDLKLSHLRMSIFAAGGRTNMTKQHYGAVGRQLRTQYEYLDGFVTDLQNGKLTRERALARSGMYGASTRLAFHESEKITRSNEAFKKGMRVLDPAARHCPECLSYATLDFVPISEIVPIGSRCSCSSRCRCQIIWRKY